MAIEKKLIHFSKLSDFQTQLNAGNILDYSIVFIQDAKRIWTRGNYYYCNEVNLDDYLTAEEIAELYATQEWANEAQEFINDFNADIADLYVTKQDVLKSGENIKTINGESLLGSGNITITGSGNSEANVSAVDTSETLDDVSGVTYVKYVAQTLTEAQKAQARTNIGALSANDQVTVDLSNYYTKEEIDSQLGDINSILESIIGGESSIFPIVLVEGDNGQKGIDLYNYIVANAESGGMSFNSGDVTWNGNEFTYGLIQQDLIRFTPMPAGYIGILLDSNGYLNCSLD